MAGEVGCKCDPLYKLLESCMSDIIREESQKFGEAITIKSTHEPINHCRSGEDLCGDEVSQTCAESNVNLLLSKFRERCIRTYWANIFRHVSKESASVSLTYQFFTGLRSLWRSLLAENQGKVLSQMDLNGWFSLDDGSALYKNIRICKDLAMDSVSVPQEKHSSISITLLTPVASELIIKWILQCYPRPVVGSACCRQEHCWVSLGMTEFGESSVNIPIAQYRKYLTARVVAIALGKAGYFVDATRFYALPKEKKFTRSVFIASEGRDGSKTVQRFETGLVTVKEVSAHGTKTYGDVSAEHFHNLRLQGIKIVNKSNLEGSRMGFDADLSWIISATNLTTAIMNYDLLLNDAAADIELLASDQQDSAGMLLIMYNYARILSILKKFSIQVINKDYPTLPSVELIDFELLASNEEISLVQLIWQWPRIAERTVDFLENTLNIALLLKSVKELATRFNSFYKLSKVLEPPNAPHNFAKMFARIHLLEACRRVFEEFLEILQVQFISDHEFSCE